MRYLVGHIGYAWAAGIVDGEGCISSHLIANRRGKEKKYRQLHLTITQASLDGPPEMLLRMKSLFGGWRVVKRADVSGYKPTYYWGLSTKDTVRAVLRMWPYLGRVKRQQALATGMVSSPT